MLILENASVRVKAHAEQIVAECRDEGYTFKDFELLVRELEECCEDMRETLRSSTLPNWDRTARF